MPGRQHVYLPQTQSFEPHAQTATVESVCDYKSISKEKEKKNYQKKQINKNENYMYIQTQGK